MYSSAWLREAADKLKDAEVPSYRLDAELLLSAALDKNRTYLHAHAEAPITGVRLRRANDFLKRRQKRTPLAYILRHKEFYGRDFTVTPDVLIPRPETETLIEMVEGLTLPNEARIADIGTGSGAIAVTLQRNHPSRQIFATDISAEALAVAKQNARNLHADVTFIQGSLLMPLEGQFDVIVANLPYVDPSWKRSPETNFEPALALFAESHGLSLIERLIAQAPAYITNHGYVLLEADPDQHAAILLLAQQQSLRHIRTEDYAVLLQR